MDKRKIVSRVMALTLIMAVLAGVLTPQVKAAPPQIFTSCAVSKGDGGIRLQAMHYGRPIVNIPCKYEFFFVNESEGISVSREVILPSNSGRLDVTLDVSLPVGAYTIRYEYINSLGSREGPFYFGAVTINVGEGGTEGPDEPKGEEPLIKAQDYYTRVTEEFRGELELEKGTQPVTWKFTSTFVPEWLFLNEEKGELYGKPAEVGTFVVSVMAENAYGEAYAGVIINVDSPISDDATLKSLSVRDGSTSKPLGGVLIPSFRPEITSYTLDADRGASSIVIEAVANHERALVTGTGEKSFTEGRTPFDIVVTAEDGTIKTYTITVRCGGTQPFITIITPIPRGSVGKRYSYQFFAYGDEPITWSYTGTMPANMYLDSDGRLHGTPTAAGFYDKLTVIATNDFGKDYFGDFWLYIDPPVAESSTNASTYSSSSESDTSRGTQSGSSSSWVPISATSRGGSTWTGGDLEFTVSVDGLAPAHLRAVKVDTQELASSNYTVRAGSVIVTLKESYLRTLAPGDYVLGLEFVGYSGSKVFTVGAALAEQPSVPLAGSESFNNTYNPDTGR